MNGLGRLTNLHWFRFVKGCFELYVVEIDVVDGTTKRIRIRLAAGPVPSRGPESSRPKV